MAIMHVTSVGPSRHSTHPDPLCGVLPAPSAAVAAALAAPRPPQLTDVLWPAPPAAARLQSQLRLAFPRAEGEPVLKQSEPRSRCCCRHPVLQHPAALWP